jgi:hypothetical protein
MSGPVVSLEAFFCGIISACDRQRFGGGKVKAPLISLILVIRKIRPYHAPIVKEKLISILQRKIFLGACSRGCEYMCLQPSPSCVLC